MSDLSKCNFCKLQQIKARAKKNNQKVSLLKGVCVRMLSGTDVYVHPKSIKKLDIEADRDTYEQFWEIWFMELPARCAC